MLISFIIPVYNAGEYLMTCVDSLLKQSYPQIEVILVNDGSTDNSGEVCDEYAGKDSRVRVFHQENGGVHTARNLGIQESKGQYVMFVDSDDWIEENTVESILRILKEKDPDILRFNFIREYYYTSAKKVNSFVKEGLSIGDDYRKVFRQTIGLIGKEWKHPENFNFLSAAWANVFRRELIINNQLLFVPREPIGSFEDGLFNIKAMTCAKSFYYMDQHFYHYRKTNAGACTANYREEYLGKQTHLFDQLYQIVVTEKEPEFLEAFYSRVNFSNLELCLNVLKSPKKWYDQCKEIRQILKSPIHYQARKHLKLKCFSVKWKVYFFFVKYRMTLLVYAMTRIIRYFQKRGG